MAAIAAKTEHHNNLLTTQSTSAVRLKFLSLDEPGCASLTRATLTYGHAVWLSDRHEKARTMAGLFVESTLVGTAGFEPTTLCPPGRCATRLRYAPNVCGSLALRRADDYSRTCCFFLLPPGEDDAKQRMRAGKFQPRETIHRSENARPHPPFGHLLPEGEGKLSGATGARPLPVPCGPA